MRAFLATMAPMCETRCTPSITIFHSWTMVESKNTLIELVVLAASITKQWQLHRMIAETLSQAFLSTLLDRRLHSSAWSYFCINHEGLATLLSTDGDENITSVLAT
ncbi:hypothetical protein CI102_13038 [Trichoderma harzianum]|nr:hypothetical protein CI102_13038 [Trichoderma harzianum]